MLPWLVIVLLLWILTWLGPLLSQPATTHA
jgi:hypothetical protein